MQLERFTFGSWVTEMGILLPFREGGARAGRERTELQGSAWFLGKSVPAFPIGLLPLKAYLTLLLHLSPPVTGVQDSCKQRTWFGDQE